MSTDARPDAVYMSQGMPVAIFGQAPAQPYGAPADPIPTVYASGWTGGEIEIANREFERLSLADAEQYARGLAERILAAVAYQRSVVDPFTLPAGAVTR